MSNVNNYLNGPNLELILFIANNVFPVFLIIGLGFALRKINLINANFCTIANQLIFMVALPAFIFAEMLKMDVRKAFDFNLIGYVYLGTFATVFLAWITGKILKAKDSDFGAFIQGSYRGNLAIIGLALIGNVGGTIALGKAAIVLAFVMPLYNVIAIVVLSFYSTSSNAGMYKKVLKDIAVNPLMIALVLGFVFSLARITLPAIAQTTVNYLASLSLPLALIGIGGSLSRENLIKSKRFAVIAASLKLVAAPVILTLIAYQIGFRGYDLLVIYISFGAPTAIVSYVMAESMGGNGGLASSVILITTFFSVLTISAAVFVMKALGLF